MKGIFVIILSFMVVLGLVTVGFGSELKCNACHKGDKSLDKIVAAKKITTAADLTAAVKAGKQHASVKDEEIAEAAKSLNLK